MQDTTQGLHPGTHMVMLKWRLVQICYLRDRLKDCGLIGVAKIQDHPHGFGAMMLIREICCSKLKQEVQVSLNYSLTLRCGGCVITKILLVVQMEIPIISKHGTKMILLTI